MNATSTRRGSIFGGLLVAATVLFVGCRESRASAYEYAVPEKTKDGWETAALNDEKLDAGLIKDLFDRISDNTYKNISSVVIVKNGKLVIEEYFPRQEVRSLPLLVPHGDLKFQRALSLSGSNLASVGVLARPQSGPGVPWNWAPPWA